MTRVPVQNVNQRVNGHGAVDLGQVKHAAQLVATQMRDAGLVCQCGERIRSPGVQFFALIQTQQGPRLGVRTVCAPTCPLAAQAAASAICSRDARGNVTWLDELRQAEAQAQADARDVARRDPTGS